MALTRRQFVSGAATAGMIAALGVISGCSQESSGDTSGNGVADGSAATKEISASSEMDADIVIVGGGMSGLAAAVSAGSGDKKVVLLEANTVTGGNGRGTEGMFGCNSSLQQAAGISFTLAEIIEKENIFFNFRNNALAWRDMVSASGPNIDWLMDQGVQFGKIDNYHNQGQVDGFHWFAVDSTESYINPMTAKAEELGVEIMLETRARQLIMKDGAIAGIYAEDSNGDFMQINCKAVILASGGYADNDEKLAELGIDTERVSRMGFPHHEGDGLDMALAVGGVDVRDRCCIMREPGTSGYDFGTPMGALGFHAGGPYMYVNERGERYTNEYSGELNTAYIANGILTQKASYAIINDALLNELDASEMATGIAAAAQDAMDSGAEVYKADTIEELADKIGVDSETLTSELERYNGFCAKGNDEDFSKDPKMLRTMETGPFWAIRHGFFYFSTVGGIHTNRRFEVVDSNDEPIPGLWAVGTDGCELYRETYTVMVPASNNANNVNSGRTAGREALEYCEG